jgi:putative ABC transport system permease protein
MSSVEVSLASIHPSYFEVLQAPVRTGRAFSGADLSPDARVVIVDQGFVDIVMAGRNPVGHVVRISSAPNVDPNSSQHPSYEIVGVVKELGMAHPVKPRRTAGVYLPFVPGSRSAMSMLVRGSGDPMTIAPRIRELATAVDPNLRIEEIMRYDQVTKAEVWFLALWVRITVGLTAVALLLSLAGIYSVLSYTVARRTREIGVRVALGASERRVITSIFRRPLTQVAAGVMAGSVLIALAALFALQQPEMGGTGRGLTIGEIATLIGYAILMLGVCLLACVVPTMRALRVQPSEALRAE